MKYRPEIDGFRAIAVLSVLVFHFYPVTIDWGFSGFLGVDIFFVISGFLISKYLLTSLESGSFTFAEFYYRRVKRILPVSFVVLAVTTALAVFILTPADHRNFSFSAISALFFVPNFYFWRTGGYFGELDTLKPLLHYWSLGIEEQFYLIFPLALFIGLKFFKKRNFLFAIILLITLFSFIVNLFLLSIGGDNPAFFLLPSRMWEFGFGALAAFANTYWINFRFKYLSDIICAFLALGLFFPGFGYLPQSLVVVFFTAIYLAVSHDSRSFSYKLLTSSISRFIGKVSFSLYLWHWPIIVFIGYMFIDGTPAIYTVVAILATLLLSFLSFKYIEEPYRRQQNKTKLYKLLFFSASFIFVVSLTAINKDLTFFNTTLVKNISKEVQTNWRCPATSYEFFGGSRACHLKGEKSINKADTLLIGNSHAQMYAPLLVDNDRFNNVYLIPLNSCTPTVSVNISEFCLEAANKNFSAIKELNNVSQVVIGTTYYRDFYMSKKGKATKEDYANDLISLVKAFNEVGIKTYLIGPIPIPKFNFASKASRGLKFRHLTELEYSNYASIERHKFMDSISMFDESLSLNLGDRYLNAYDYFCDSEYCYYGDQGGAFFSDTNHVGNYGLLRMSDMLEDLD